MKSILAIAQGVAIFLWVGCICLAAALIVIGCTAYRLGSRARYLWELCLAAYRFAIPVVVDFDYCQPTTVVVEPDPEPIAQPDPVPVPDYAGMTIRQLKAMAKGSGIPKYWLLTKPALIAAFTA